MGQQCTGIDPDQAAVVRGNEFGFVSQSFHLIEAATVRENVELPAAYAGVGGSSRRRRACEILERLGMQDRLAHRPAELSGGEQQRTAVARALMNGGHVILADEPTGALDADNGQRILHVLADLAKRGHTVIVASHDTAIDAYAPRRIELRDGRLVADTAPTRQVAAPAAPHGPAGGFKERPRRTNVQWVCRTALASLVRAPLPSAFGVLSMAVGIGLVVSVLGFAAGAYDASKQALGQMGADRISISDPSNPLKGLPSRLTIEDAQAIKDNVANIRETVPRLHRSATVRYGEHAVDAGLDAEGTAAPPQFMYEEFRIEKGTLLSEADDEARARVAILGAGLYQRLFAPAEDPIGATLLVDQVPYAVKGVLAPHPIAEGPHYEPERARDIQTFLNVPYRSAVADLFPTDANMTIDVFATHPLRVEQAADDIRDLLFRRHGPGRFSLMVHQRLLGVHQDIAEQSYVTLGAVGAIALIVSASGVLALMLATLAQRRREVGIRMAVGADRLDIFSQFLVETIGIVCAGALAGMFVGYVVAPGVGDMLDLPVAMRPWFLPAALGLALASGVVAGILPALRAANLNPLNVLAG